jgi:hypothetical protein
LVDPLPVWRNPLNERENTAIPILDYIRGVGKKMAGVHAEQRASIKERTLRTDRWWLQPAITVFVLVSFIVYATFRAFENKHYFVEKGELISPFYSPCLSDACVSGSQLFGTLGPSSLMGFTLSPALLILIFPLGFRLTCYYYRKAYYRSFWQSPPACAVAEPHKKYTGETTQPLILQNAHRWFFYAGLVFNVILTYDAFLAFHGADGGFGMSVGTLVLLANATLLWLYSLSCHTCRHTVGGRLRHFSQHPWRYKFWTQVSTLNHHHAKFAWVSLFGVALADLYVRLVSTGAITNYFFF